MYNKYSLALSYSRHLKVLYYTYLLVLVVTAATDAPTAAADVPTAAAVTATVLPTDMHH